MPIQPCQLTTRGLRSDNREWFWNQTNVDRTIAALSTLSADFTDASYKRTVIAIELINEPFPQNPDEVGFLRDFYQRAYYAVRQASKDTDMVVALDSAFQGLGAWQGFMLTPDYYEVAMDTVSPSPSPDCGVYVANAYRPSISTRCLT